MPTSSAISRTVAAATPLRANRAAATARICACLSAGSRLMSVSVVLVGPPGAAASSVVVVAARPSIVRPRYQTSACYESDAWPCGPPGPGPNGREGGHAARADDGRGGRGGTALGHDDRHRRLGLAKPMSLVRATCRSGLARLTVVSYGGPDVGLLLAVGKVAKLVYGFVSLDTIALEPHFRAARQAGAIEVAEYDEGML